ncbi:MAG TPA: EAL domain-containing protein [Steroidobacteraceae bacterium]
MRLPSRDRVIAFMKRHRIKLTELGLLLAVMLVATFLVYEVDLFWDEGQLTPHETVIELDEALLLGGLLAVGLLVFAVRRYLDQRRETRRRVAAEQQVRRLAFQDDLTGLPNRRQFDDALKAALDCPPRSGSLHAVLLMDLNGFKHINDTHGHGIGDEVLVIVAQRLLSTLREGDLLARFGGDEFALLAQHLLGAESATHLARRIIAALEKPIVTGRITHKVGAGIGIALIPQDASTLREAMRRADVALYRAKAERRSALRFFETQMDQQVAERDQMETHLREALQTGQIQPLFQPATDLKTGRITSFEVLPHWRHQELGEISPQRFVPIAEDVGLIHELADSLLRQACAAAAQWPADVKLAVDIFPGQLKDRELPVRILLTLAQYNIDARRLELEITESVLVQDLEGAKDVLAPLRAAGATVTLDNFGTGYSTLYHLQNFKLDKVKIDRSFVAEMGSNREQPRLFNALAGLGHGLGLKVAVEGVESLLLSDTLIENGCEEGQGPWFGAPLSAQESVQFISQRPADRVALPAHTASP